MVLGASPPVDDLEEEGHDQEASPLIEASPNYGELA
jgi:hypothetical protein